MGFCTHKHYGTVLVEENWSSRRPLHRTTPMAHIPAVIHSAEPTPRSSTIITTISTAMITGRLPTTTPATERLHRSTDTVGRQPLRRFHTFQRENRIRNGHRCFLTNRPVRKLSALRSRRCATAPGDLIFLWHRGVATDNRRKNLRHR